ncbi:16S rRNA (guanine(527)-N(7))-methyltransferase RsmG [Pelagibacteraceae bacterium]|nr:16S rRNA (guanine(527)-N(7))-methyltransferase RsmG [Pelagibacteraceae bacterium]MDC3156435.1 16S rRNA (guanine(527)-N(7))-methyltransferase RsmG [Pelagibacteraceae bacterium]
MDKNSVIKKYNLSRKQIDLIESYINNLKKNNQTHNLVGQSTIDVAWDRHINDSLQLSEFILKKKASIIDLGTGAGLPGIILHIFGYTNILLIDSKMKKVKFINEFAHANNFEIKTICTRVEKIKNQKFDFIVCRAFAPLVKLLDYSRFFTKKNTSLLFLKGRSVMKEIEHAKKSYSFKYELYPSKSEGDGFVLKINKYNKL